MGEFKQRTPEEVAQAMQRLPKPVQDLLSEHYTGKDTMQKLNEAVFARMKQNPEITFPKALLAEIERTNPELSKKVGAALAPPEAARPVSEAAPEEEKATAYAKAQAGVSDLGRTEVVAAGVEVPLKGSAITAEAGGMVSSEGTDATAKVAVEVPAGDVVSVEATAYRDRTIGVEAAAAATVNFSLGETAGTFVGAEAGRGGGEEYSMAYTGAYYEGETFSANVATLFTVIPAPSVGIYGEAAARVSGSTQVTTTFYTSDVKQGTAGGTLLLGAKINFE